MPEYDFRLRFNMAESYRIDSDKDGFDLLTLQTGERIELRSGGIGSPVKQHNSAAILGKSFASKEEARGAAEKSKRALLHWAIEQRVGLDLGGGKQRNIVTKEGLALYRKQLGCPCRNDIHGIDVYEHEEKVKFIKADVKAVVGKSQRNFITTFQREYVNSRPLTEKQQLASEIYVSSFFDVSPRSRFITLVTAIEALLERPKRADHIQALVTKLTDMTKQAGIDTPTKDSIISGLGELRNQSIRQAGQMLVSCLLPDHVINGQSAADFFRLCYDQRSAMLHDGITSEESVDVWHLANKIEELVHRLLLASLSNASLEGVTPSIT